MGMPIRNSSTRSNLTRLRDHVSHSPQTSGDRKISILIDCTTGEINIPQPISALEQKIQNKKAHDHPAKHFKHAELAIHISKEGVAFDLNQSDPKTSLEKQANQVMEETLKILNWMGKQAESAQDALLNCVRSTMSELPEEICRHTGWAGSINRTQAEKLLNKHSIGTYLLREGDGETRKIEENLCKHNAAALRCFVLTIVEKDHKISDKLLIQENVGWAIYNDDPHMNHYTYKPLMNTLREAGAGHPLNISAKKT